MSFDRHLLTRNCIFVDILAKERTFHYIAFWYQFWMHDKITSRSGLRKDVISSTPPYRKVHFRRHFVQRIRFSPSYVLFWSVLKHFLMKFCLMKMSSSFYWRKFKSTFIKNNGIFEKLKYAEKSEVMRKKFFSVTMMTSWLTRMNYEECEQITSRSAKKESAI